MERKINPKREIRFAGASFFVLSVLLIFLLIYPLFQEVKRKFEELISIKKQQVLLIERKEDIEEMKNIFAEHEKDFEKMENLFIDSENPLDFINFLEEQAVKSKVYFKITSLGPGKEQVPWPSLSFQIEIAGPFKNFSKFLERLESVPYLIQIVNLSLKRLGEREVKKEEFKEFSVGDVQTFLLIKAFTK